MPPKETDDIVAAKQALRREMMARREALDGVRRKAGAEAIAAQAASLSAERPGAIVSAYAAIGEEIDPLPMIEKLIRLEHRIALPVTVGKDKPLVFRAWQPAKPLVESNFGLRVPADDAEVLTPEILLVPLLAFDRRGMRLGYGGGYYDRTLRALRQQAHTLAIGVAFAEQEVDSVPAAPYDEPLDRVLTPLGVIQIEGK